MAHTHDFWTRKGAARWRATPVPTPASDAAPQSEAAQSPAGWVKLQAAGAGVRVSPAIRSKLRGLRLGERRLLYALGDWLILSGGALFILSHSVREYDTGSMIIS